MITGWVVERVVVVVVVVVVVEPVVPFDGDAEVVDGNTIYILPTAEKGSCIMVASKWTDEYGRVKEYHYYTLTVE